MDAHMRYIILYIHYVSICIQIWGTRMLSDTCPYTCMLYPHLHACKCYLRLECTLVSLSRTCCTRSSQSNYHAEAKRLVSQETFCAGSRASLASSQIACSLALEKHTHKAIYCNQHRIAWGGGRGGVGWLSSVATRLGFSSAQPAFGRAFSTN